MFFPEGYQSGSQSGSLFKRVEQTLPGIDAQIDGHLIVAAAAGVDLLAEVSQFAGKRAFDREVYDPLRRQPLTEEQLRSYFEANQKRYPGTFESNRKKLQRPARLADATRVVPGSAGP